MIDPIAATVAIAVLALLCAVAWSTRERTR
jgi:hypothetical protein